MPGMTRLTGLLGCWHSHTQVLQRYTSDMVEWAFMSSFFSYFTNLKLTPAKASRGSTVSQGEGASRSVPLSHLIALVGRFSWIDTLH